MPISYRTLHPVGDRRRVAHCRLKELLPVRAGDGNAEQMHDGIPERDPEFVVRWFPPIEEYRRGHKITQHGCNGVPVFASSITYQIRQGEKASMQDGANTASRSDHCDRTRQRANPTSNLASSVEIMAVPRQEHVSTNIVYKSPQNMRFWSVGIPYFSLKWAYFLEHIVRIK